jgi:prepilin-type N-terminal cleavage/methylation domain-containing protein
MIRGFTLIELLIVIALLGALVIGLLTALDPIEQIRRGRDTGLRNTSSEFFNALNRYYTSRYQFPWGGTTLTSNASAMGTDITALINTGELKSNFYTRAGGANLVQILVTATAGSDLSICYRPQSKAMQLDPATIYGSSGVTASNCKSLGGTAGTADCYLCMK